MNVFEYVEIYRNCLQQDSYFCEGLIDHDKNIYSHPNKVNILYAHYAGSERIMYCF